MMSKVTGQPYYAVIFTSQKNQSYAEEYEIAANRMVELAEKQPGFVGIESTRSPDGIGITVSYWQSENDIRTWKTHLEHMTAQKNGREAWYKWYRVRVCKVEREYSHGDTP